MTNNFYVFLMLSIFPYFSAFAATTKSDPFQLAHQIQDSFKNKNYNSLKPHLGSEATIDEKEFFEYFKEPANGELEGITLAKLITDADLIYIEAGETKNGISGVIYYVKTPKLQKRREWLIDYAACAFSRVNSKLKLRNGFCFLGTDGAPELDSVEGTLILESKQ